MTTATIRNTFFMWTSTALLMSACDDPDALPATVGTDDAGATTTIASDTSDDWSTGEAPSNGSGALGLPSQSSFVDQSPIGWLDGIVGNRVMGWACDPDTPTASIEVHLYVGGPAGSQSAVWATGGVMANLDSEGAINSACGGGTAHRFDWYMPASVRAQLGQSPRPLYAYGINTNSGGANPALSGSPKTIAPSTPEPSRTNAVANSSFEEGMEGWTAISGTGTSTMRWSESAWRPSHERAHVLFALGGGPASPAGLCAVEQLVQGVTVRPNATYNLAASYLDPQRSSRPGYSGGATYYGGEWMRILVGNPANPGERYAVAVHRVAATPGGIGPTAWSVPEIGFSTGASPFGVPQYNGINGAPLGTIPKDITGWNLYVGVGKDCGYLLGNSSGDSYHAQTWIDHVQFSWLTTPGSALTPTPSRDSGQYVVAERGYVDPNDQQTTLGNGRWAGTLNWQQTYHYAYAPSVMFKQGQYLLWNNIGWYGDSLGVKINASLGAMFSQKNTLVHEGYVDKGVPSPNAHPPGVEFDFTHIADPSVIDGGDGWYYIYYSGASDNTTNPIKGGLGIARARQTLSTPWGWEAERLNVAAPLTALNRGGYGTGQPAVARGANGYYYMVYTHQPYPTPKDANGNPIYDPRNVARVLRASTPDFSQAEWVHDVSLSGIGIVGDLAFAPDTNEFVIVANLSTSNNNLLRLHFYSGDLLTFTGYADFVDAGGVFQFGEQPALLTDSQKQLLPRNPDQSRSLTFFASTYKGSGDLAHISGPTAFVRFNTVNPGF